MERIWIAVTAAALALAIPGYAAAQNPPQQVAQTAPKEFASSPLPPRSDSPMSATQPDQTEQPTSLGEIARLVRARRAGKGDPKPARVYDDDNFPRSAGKGDKASEIYIGEAQSGGSSRAQLAGKAVLLDFWATWCGPCRGSLPDLKQFVSGYGGQLEVVSISEDANERDWQNFVSKNGMNWSQQHDPDGSTARRFGVTALPTYILIGSDGTIIQRYVGASRIESLADRMAPDLKQALEGKP